MVLLLYVEKNYNQSSTFSFLDPWQICCQHSQLGRIKEAFLVIGHLIIIQKLGSSGCFFSRIVQLFLLVVN